MVSVFASCSVDRHIKDYKIGIFRFSSKSKDWLVRNHDNVSRWHAMSTIQACWSSTKRVSSPSHQHVTCSLRDITDTLLILALSNNNHLYTHLKEGFIIDRICSDVTGKAFDYHNTNLNYNL